MTIKDNVLDKVLNESSVAHLNEGGIGASGKQPVQRLDEGYHSKDDILQGFSFGGLVLAVRSNVPNHKIDKNSIMKEFKNMLESRIDDAKYEVNKNMKQLLKESKEVY